jgi:hypothetical protein
MKDRFRDKHDALVDHYYEGYRAGRTVVDLSKDARAQIIAAVAAARTEADDDVLVDWGRLLSRQYRALAVSSPEQCYLYASGVGWIGDPAKLLPTDLQHKDVEIEARMLATARARPDADPSATTRLERLPTWPNGCARNSARSGSSCFQIPNYHPINTENTAPFWLLFWRGHLSARRRGGRPDAACPDPPVEVNFS